MLNGLEIIGAVGALYTLAVFLISLSKFNNIEQQFLKKLGPSFAMALVTMLIVVFFSGDKHFFLLLSISEFLFMLSLFYNYLKSNFYFMSAFFFLTYFEDIMVILSVYFSLYLTGSIFQSKSQEGGGSIFVVSSYILLDIALLLQAFYILGLNSTLLFSGVSIFILAVVLFLFPFVEGGIRINAQK